MFDHYLEYQRPDSKRARLLRRAMVVSTTGTSLVLVWLWVQGKLSIVPVDPPTIQFIMVQMTQDEPPPPPPPPPPPAGDTEEEEEVVEEDEPIEEEVVQPDEVKDKIPDAKPGKPAFKAGVPGGVPGGVIGGVPGGVLGGVVGGQVKQAGTGETVKAKLEAVMARAIFQPTPATAALQQTPTGKFSRKPGSTIISFCVESTGKTDDVRTVKGFPGDPAIDAIVRDTVKKWRFKPLVVGGKARRECTEKTFNITWK